MAPGLQIIPTDIIEAWAKGEYFLGDVPSLSYSRLGTALFLRSWYTYQDRNELAGVAKIDIKGPVLLMGGIRLLEKGKRCAVFWQTEVSHFVDDTEILWFHAVLDLDASPDFKSTAADYVTDEWLKGKGKVSVEKQFGMKPAVWNQLLDRLYATFDTDVARLRQICPPERIDHGMLRFPIATDAQGRHSCEYYQFYTPDPAVQRKLLQGTSYFKKAAKVPAR
jgi:hypothetical protein